jgi:NAD(P)H dehydrogenase (quinone)
MSQTLLVTGAAGKMGSRVVELLLEANAGKIIAGTRNPEKLADLQGRGVEVRKVDFDDPDGLVSAFAGVDRLLIISTDVVDGTDRRAKQHINAVRAAEAAGVKHVIYTSLTNPGPESPISLAPDHHATEEALKASSLDWTVLRNNVYTDGLLQSLPRAIETGQLVAATGTGGVGMVTREDCSRAAAAALASQSSGRTVLDITGPALVTRAEIAQIASEISGRTVEYIPIEAASLKSGLQAAGLPEPIANLIVSFDQGVADGTLSVVSNAVEELTGKPAQSVRDFLYENRAALQA